MSDREGGMTNHHSKRSDDGEPYSKPEEPLTLDDMLAAVRLLKRPLLCRIEIGEDMLGFISDMMCGAHPKPLLDDTIFGGVPIVDSEWLPAGWARGVDQDGNTLFLMTRDRYYDFSKVSTPNFDELPMNFPTDQLVFWNNWGVTFPCRLEALHTWFKED